MENEKEYWCPSCGYKLDPKMFCPYCCTNWATLPIIEFENEIKKQDYDNTIKKYGELNKPEPMSIQNKNFAIWDLVIKDMAERDSIGIEKYNTRLQGFNGRDALKDAYQEALDLAVYLRQAIYERDGR